MMAVNVKPIDEYTPIIYVSPPNNIKYLFVGGRYMPYDYYKEGGIINKVYCVSNYNIFKNTYEGYVINYTSIINCIHNIDYFYIYKIIESYYKNRWQIVNVLEIKFMLYIIYEKMRKFEKHFLLQQLGYNHINTTIIELINYKTMDIIYENHINNNRKRLPSI